MLVYAYGCVYIAVNRGDIENSKLDFVNKTNYTLLICVLIKMCICLIMRNFCTRLLAFKIDDFLPENLHFRVFNKDIFT